MDDLERPDDPSTVAGFDPSGCERIEASQLLVHRLEVVARLQCGPDVGKATGDVQVVDDRPHVQPGAAHQQGPSAPVLDVGDGLPRGTLEPAQGEVLVRGDQVDQMVRHLGALGRRGFRGADVHAPIDLHRVGRDDLDVAECPGDIERQRRLAGRRRPDERQPAGGTGQNSSSRTT